MGTRLVTYHPLPYNWGDVSGGASPPWRTYGTPTFIPVSDGDIGTGVSYGWLNLNGTKPVRGVLGLNLVQAPNQPGGGLANPTLNPGESWSRWRVVVGTSNHPTGNVNTGNWSIRIRDWVTVLGVLTAGSTSLGWGVYASPWFAGETPLLLALDVAPNQMWTNGTGTADDWAALFGFWGISVEAEISFPDPPGQPSASFTAAMRADRKTVDVDASSSSPGANTTMSSYQWDFGDGTKGTATGVTASYTYAKTGTYPVTLRVTNSASLSATAVRNAIANIPGTGGQPEVPDPDPTLPPIVAPPALPPTDTQLLWLPVATEWATEFSKWQMVTPVVKPAAADVSPTLFEVGAAGQKRGVLTDASQVTGIRSVAADAVLTLRLPIGSQSKRTPLTAGTEYKRFKVQVRTTEESIDPTSDTRTWNMSIKKGATVLGDVSTLAGGWWESDAIPFIGTDADMDQVVLVLTDVDKPGVPLFSEIRVLADYGIAGQITLPPIPLDSDDVIYSLYGTLHLSVTPGAAGVPPLGSAVSNAGTGTPFPAAAAIQPDPNALQIDNGITLPFGYGIGGYGLDVGCIDGNGVEWWLTDVEGWDDGMSVELATVEPSLGTGTFVSNVRETGREVTVSGSLVSDNRSALRAAKRRLAGVLSQPPHVGWMHLRGLILPVALAEPVRIDHVSPSRVDFEATFRGVRAPYSMGMGVWREGRIHSYRLAATAMADVPETGSTPMTPIVTVTGPLAEGSRLDVISPGATYRSGGFVLAKAVPAGVALSFNSITRTAVYKGTKTPAGDFVDWGASRWMYLDARGCRLIADGTGGGSWLVEGRELW